MMFCMIVPKIVFSWASIDIQFFWRTLSARQQYLISMDLESFCLIVSFKIPNAVELSVINGVAGCVVT
jgi:hypothetical protein